MFESHAGILGYDTFMEFSLPHLREIAKGVKGKLGSDAVPMVSYITAITGTNYTWTGNAYSRVY